ncbi:alpha/beta hydrolase [Amaricoccus sp.]|uniref:alpha/beta fold hydrolase n=1 Tax=Amaricoccus sp. TaxID=1872485 RepID=UPI001B587EDF|nr:alpha/beta hydrolase [Amaricoccus sp.]MBP7241557.1 alpha/beta hydrolase [Amaricoccus sp.]
MKRTARLCRDALRSSVVVASVAVPALAAEGEVAGAFDIGDGRRMYLECRGTGSPTVLVVPGGKASAEDWTQGAPVFADVAAFTRVCAYDRPGTPLADGSPSRSDPAPMPTSAAASVADLRALVVAAKVATPFVIVGHSYGGLVVRLYAMTWPGDVAGMVLVDALSEFLRVAETPDEWRWQKIILDGDMTESLKIYPELERADADESFDQLLAAPPLRPMPLVVLSADHPWGPLVPGFIADGLLGPDTPPDVGYVTDRAQKVAQADLAALVPAARHVTKTDSGHNIHKNNPQLVTDAIRDVVDAVRSGRTALGP